MDENVKKEKAMMNALTFKDGKGRTRTFSNTTREKNLVSFPF
jgi:hypothetical protein